MCLVVIDCFTRYIEEANLTSTTTAHVKDKLKSKFTRYRVPETVVTDNGPRFSATEFADFTRGYDSRHVTSSPRYPQSNGDNRGQIELCVRYDLSWVRERIHTRHSWLRGLARCHMDHPQHSY
jgi:transposase InsO family protein